MRIVRLVRVTERLGMDIFGIALNNEALFRGLRNVQAPSAAADPARTSRRS